MNVSSKLSHQGSKTSAHHPAKPELITTTYSPQLNQTLLQHTHELHILIHLVNMKLPTLLNGITLLMRSISALKIPPTPVSAPQNTTVQWINTQGTEPFNSTETGPCANLPLLSRLQCMLVGIGSPHGEVATEIVPPPPRQMEEQADQYLFNMTLESFISLRDQRYPSYFFWESDGCSQSPDAPFGFPFLPACYRHDFGYDQYKKVCTVSHC